VSDQVRARFESWFEQNPTNREALVKWREGVGYRDDAYYLNGCWQGWQAATDESAGQVKELRRLIADDAYACTFQTFGQYRTALLKAFDAALKGD
jgi:hypothetical protein